MDDEGVTGGGPIDVTVGIGSTPPGPVVASTAATGAGSMAEWMPNHDRPTATEVTAAQASRYPTDRLTATTFL